VEVLGSDVEGFHHDAVIVVVQEAVFDEHVARTDDINAIGRDDFTDLAQVAHGRAGAGGEHEHPAGGANQGDAFDEHVGTVLHHDERETAVAFTRVKGTINDTVTADTDVVAAFDVDTTFEYRAAGEIECLPVFQR